MELTPAERAAIERGEVVNFMLPDSHVPCVVVRADLLDAVRARADLTPLDPDQLSILTAEVLDDEDWTIPEERATEQPG